jgi:hypothetical protein
MKLFKNGLKIWLVGTMSSFVPFVWYGIIFGSLSVLISTLLLLIIFKKELS